MISVKAGAANHAGDPLHQLHGTAESVVQLLIQGAVAFAHQLLGALLQGLLALFITSDCLVVVLGQQPSDQRGCAKAK